MSNLAVVSLNLREQAKQAVTESEAPGIRCGCVQRLMENLRDKVAMTTEESDTLKLVLMGSVVTHLEFRCYADKPRVVAFPEVYVEKIPQEALPQSVAINGGLPWLQEMIAECDAEVDVLEATSFAIDQPKIGSANAMTHAEARVKAAEYREAAKALERQIPLDLRVGSMEDGDEKT